MFDQEGLVVLIFFGEDVEKSQEAMESLADFAASRNLEFSGGMGEIVTAAEEIVKTYEQAVQARRLAQVKRKKFLYYGELGAYRLILGCSDQVFLKNFAKEKLGCLLEDEKEQINIKGTHLTVHGYELPEKYYKRFQQQYISAEEIRKSIQEPEEGRYNILLAHNPVYFEGYALWGADLTLSGHLHGGLMRLPLIGGVISPQVKLFPKYDCGLYEKYGRKLLVTAGLGSHSIAFRINNPAEFMLVELY